MRRIDPGGFTTARSGTTRAINRQIVLTLIGAHQPISRAELARLMETNRANITFIVNKLLEEGLVREGAQGEAGARGRKPTSLFLKAEKTFAVAVDVRASRTFMMLTDSIGIQIGDVTSFPTEVDSRKFARSLATNIKHTLGREFPISRCKGIGIVLPGMVDSQTHVLRHAPTLGWHDLDLLEPLQEEFGDVDIHLENSAKACALAQIWKIRGDASDNNDIVFVSVSDGVGAGIVVKGELVRGKYNTAGEFGHLPLSIDGPPCSCGSNGCLEAYTSNIATIDRYLDASPNSSQVWKKEDFTIEKLIELARSGDGKAITSLYATARYLGLGLSLIVNALGPSIVYVGGEITEAWDLIGSHVTKAMRERTLTNELGNTPIRIVPARESPRLRGAVALVTAPAFAAPKVA